MAGVLPLLPSMNATAQLGQEKAVSEHLENGEETQLSLKRLIAFGDRLFHAVWTPQDGAGRPFSNGFGAPLQDFEAPLLFPRNFNRVSGPDSNSCFGCHNLPVSGGGGDFVTGIFAGAQRFDFATFDVTDPFPISGSKDEQGNAVTLQSIGNFRSTVGFLGGGFIEMLARQMTEELQILRDATLPGKSTVLVTKGVFFGVLIRNMDGSWDTTQVVGLPGSSTTSTGPTKPPSLLILPFQQAGAVVGLREFTNSALNHHFGIQSEERFGDGFDPDGDGYQNEVTIADVTAMAIYQATLPVPGRIIPDDPQIEAAVKLGEQTFVTLGCVSCHVPALPLTDDGWIFTEPGPYNPPGNLQPGQAPIVSVDLLSSSLPNPRLKKQTNVVWVPMFSDLKLHDITSGPNDPQNPHKDPLDLNAPQGTKAFLAGTTRFLTRRLWGSASEPPFFHHGKFLTFRDAIEAHGGEATAQINAWWALSDTKKNAVIEFLKTLVVLPKGTSCLVCNPKLTPKRWPAFPWPPP